MQRFSGASPVASPNRPNFGKPSPLARVTEESSAPIKVHTNGVKPTDKLVELETPRPSEDRKANKTLDALLEPMSLEDKENVKSGDGKASGHMNGKIKAPPAPMVEDESAMKTIEI